MTRPVLTPLDGDGIIDTDELVDLAVTAAKLAADAVETAKILNAAVTPAKLSNPVGVAGYSQKTSNQTGITSITDVTGLSITWTAAVGRLYLVHSQVYSSAAGGSNFQGHYITSGADVMHAFSGRLPNDSVGTTNLSSMSVLVVGSGGSVTRKVRVARESGTDTVTVLGSSDRPSHISVIEIGAT